MSFSLSFLGFVLTLAVFLFALVLLHKSFRQLATKTNYAGVKQMLVCFYSYCALLMVEVLLESMQPSASVLLKLPVLFTLIMVVGFAILMIFVFSFKSFVEDVVARYKK